MAARIGRRAGTILAGGLLALLAVAASVDQANAQAVLTGGTQIGTSFQFMWTSPGGTPFYSTEEPAKMPFPAGTLANLRVKVNNAGQPAGTVTVRLRVNNAPTLIVCTVTNFGTCTSANTHPINDNDLVTVQVNQTFGAGNTLQMTYSFELQ